MSQLVHRKPDKFGYGVATGNPMITDRKMKSKGAGPNDRWLTHSLGRRCGALPARLPGGGDRASAERSFYFRYTDGAGKRAVVKLGTYHDRGASGGLTLAQAIARASELSRLYQGGVHDLRDHLARELADVQASRLRAQEARQEAEAATARRLTVRRLFIRWQETELRARANADGTRAGRKDDGELIRKLFEKRVFPVIGEFAVCDSARPTSCRSSTRRVPTGDFEPPTSCSPASSRCSGSRWCAR